MSFLTGLFPTFIQSGLLWALPLALIPIIIHLINRYRHKTMHWGAMMFLLTAKRMTKGMAKLRHFLILAARVLAIAALIIAAARPLTSGWLALTAGGSAETTIVILDRSASMEAQDLQTGESKRSAAVKRVAEMLEEVGSTSQIVLIESTEKKPIEVGDPKILLDLPQTLSSAGSSDLPGMMQAALDYMTNNEAGRTDIWVCSDLRENDWDAAGGRWEALRSGFAERDGVRFYLLSYPDLPESNMSVSVANVHRRQIGGGDAELVMDLRIRSDQEFADGKTVKLDVVINGARTTLDINMMDRQYEQLGLTIPIDEQTRSGHGRVELQNDTNPQDNVFHFVFAESPFHRTVVVSDDKDTSSLLKLATGTGEAGIEYEATVLPTAQAAAIPWDETAFLVWHAQLPKDDLTVQQIENFVKSGRTILFFPPTSPNDTEIFGLSWADWKQPADKSPIGVAFWDLQSDLLSNTQSGNPLPVGELKTFRYCSINGQDIRQLARLDGGVPLLARSTNSTGGGVYFCSTLPTPKHSSLGDNIVTFYVMLHRALAAGAGALGKARQVDAGDSSIGDIADWQAADEGTKVLVSTERPFQNGVWKEEDRLLAINRPLIEDTAPALTEENLGEVMGDLDYSLVSQNVSESQSLVSEIWRMFLVIMVVALLLEAILCVPDRRIKTEAA